MAVALRLGAGQDFCTRPRAWSLTAKPFAGVALAPVRARVLEAIPWVADLEHGIARLDEIRASCLPA